MIDFGFDKLALIGAVALIVIGPEKLPRVARTVGTLLGKAQRYVADVKAEVNRSIELEELQKMKSQFQEAAQEVHDTVHRTNSTPNSNLVRNAGRCFGSIAGRSFLRTYSRANSGSAITPHAGWAARSPRTTKTWP